MSAMQGVLARDDEETDEKELNNIAERLHDGIEIKDRSYLLKSYPQSFVGNEAVTFMVGNGIAADRESAVELGNMLIAADVFRHVTKDHAFKDEGLYYRFVVDEPSHGATKINEETGQQWTWGDYLPGMFQSASETSLQPHVRDLNDGNTKAEFDTSQSFGVWPLDEYNQELLNNVHPVQWDEPAGDERYNIIAIGAGAAGLVSAAGTSGLGGKAAIIEEHLFGGDCLNSGCVPSKALLKAAKVAQNVIRNGEEFGLVVDGSVRVDFGKVMQRMRRIRSEISEHDACSRFTTKYGLDVFLGRATFISPDQIRVNDKVLTFSRAVIATGAAASVPNIFGLAGVGYLTNHTLWNLTELPPRLGVIGSGPIGSEMAQAFGCFGSQVTVFNRSDRILGKEDPEAAAIVKASMEQDGCTFLTGLTFKSVTYVDDSKTEIQIVVEKDGAEIVTIVDQVLIATGRKPNVENMGLEAAGVAYTVNRGVEVNDYLQTTNQNIYAAGDCCTRYQFTHMADAMARIVIRNALFFGRAKMSDLLIPWATFTFPEVAHVGLYESDLYEEQTDGSTKLKIPYSVIRYELHENDRAIADGETEGFVKVYLRQGTDEILGATIVSENAGDQINEFSIMIQAKLGLGFVAGVIHPYPTVGECIKACGDSYNRTKLTPVSKAVLRRILAARR